MHKRKIVHVSKQLKSAAKDTHPPVLTGLDEGERVRKLIEPLHINVEEDKAEEKSSASSSRLSVSSFASDQSRKLEPKETVLKILVIGDSTVGKTSYVQGFVQNKFLDTYKNTVGVDFSTKLLSHKKYGEDPVKLQIWDIAGQDRYVCLTRVYYQNSHGCIVMFDLTNRKSFESVVQWKRDLDSKCMRDDGAMLPCLLLASKCDLPNRQVETNEIEAVCQQNGFMSWIEVSSKEHLMIQDSMNFLVDRIICAKHLDTAPMRKSGISLTEEARDVPREPMGERVPNTYCWC